MGGGEAAAPRASLADQLPAGSPPLALAGFCPVTLTDQERWVEGDLRWGARHEGRTYLFAGPEQQRRFLASAARYAPVLSCQDVVLAVDESRSVEGQREFGVWFPDPERGRVFLFSSEETLAQFHRDSARYLDGLSRITGKPYQLGVRAQAYGPGAGGYR
jgi:protein disulfide-isomerase